MSTITFNPVSYGALTFTNISATETSLGAVSGFASNPGTESAGGSPVGTALQWSNAVVYVYGPGSSDVITFSYTVSASAGNLISAVNQDYTFGTSGTGVTIGAVEQVYGTTGTLLATDVYTSLTGPVQAQLSQAAQVVNVVVTLTLSVGPTAPSSSSIDLSILQQAVTTTAGPSNTASIGDIVFQDTANTGLESGFDAGPGVAGVTVELLGGTGFSVLQTTTTNASGLYSFTSLAAGVYEVEFVKPNGYAFSPQGAGSNPGINSSANATTGITAPITLTAGQADHNVEAGLHQVPGQGGTATIGNTVWIDGNGDGLDDNGEQGAAGVTVELLNAANGSILLTTTTNAAGSYQFTSLQAGTYEVQFVAPAGDQFTAQNAPGAGINSAAGASGLTAPITLASGQNDGTGVNAGLLTPIAVTGTVFTDTNADGTQDNAEAGAAGVTVQLLNAAGTSVVATATTGAGGSYSFATVAPGSYEVKVLAPTGAVVEGGGVTAPFTVTAGATPTTVTEAPVGIYLPATVSGSAYLDANRDGAQDNGETGIAGVTVELLTAAGTSVIATTTTGAAGAYSFAGLQPGTYQVEAFAPSGDIFTTQGAGSAFGATGLAGPVTLASGQAATENAGFQYAPSTVNGTVFTDTNGDLSQDNGEAGAAGVTVQLLNAAGTSVLATTTTGAGGTYSFATVSPGTYEVKVLAPAGQTVEGTGVTAPFTVAPGAAVTDPAVGLYVPATFSGEAWLDTNADGLLDNGEAGIAGVTVELLKASTGSVLATTTTGAGGTYSFAGLTPGTGYAVEVLPPAGDFFSAQGVAGGTSSVVNASTGISAAVTPTSGQAVTALDAGLQAATGLIAGSTWIDANRNGAIDAGDGELAGVTVQLLNAAGTSVLATAVSAPNGSGLDTYAFTNLKAGVYEVAVTAPAGYALTTANTTLYNGADSNFNQSTGLSAPITLAVGGQNTNVLAGFQATTGAVASTVFLDANGDGLLDNGEAGIAGATVALLNAAGTSVLATTTTSATGAYAFATVAAGTYEVQFVPPAGDKLTTQGVAGGTNSTPNATTGITAPFTVAAGQTVSTLSAGVYQPAAITGSAFADLNRDGLIDSGESTLAGVTVDLWNAAGTSVLAATTTNASGTYTFAGLAPGSYEVSFATPAGDILTTQGAAFGATDSSASATTGFTPLITLTSGQTQANADAGFQVAPPAAPATASLGDFVWLDANGNGIQDTGEAGIAGATVSLLSDTLTLKISEDAYLGDAQYTVSVNGAQVGGTYTATALHSAGQDNTLTLNGIWGGTPTVTVTFLNDAYAGTAATDRNLYVDGIIYNGTNQAKSWVQASNGSTSAALSGPAEPAVATATTNASGYYTFAGLNPGAYEVKFAAPPGDVFTTQNAGTNIALDSNASQSTGITAPVTLTAGQSNATVDAGLYAPASISSYVFFDANNDGISDEANNMVAGVTVDLWNGAGTSLIAVTTTGSGGLYAFNNLAPGTYEVSAVLPSGDQFAPYRATTAGNNINNTSAVSASTGFTPAFSITSGQSVYNVLNIGLQAAAKCAITGLTFADNNHDGIGNAGDCWQPGVTVDLWNATGTSLIATTVSAYNAAGQSAYAFNGLAAGTYEVSFVAPSGLAFTYGTQGNYGATYSNGNTYTGFTSPITLTAGQTQSNVEEGFVCANTVTGYAFQDLNRNGVYNSGETYVGGLAVTLWNASGTSVLATTTTNSSGTYTFANLANGSYEVSIAGLSGETLTAQGIGGNAALDSAFNPATGFTSSFTLSGAQTAQENAGYLYNAASISSYVFYDFNRDGISDEGNNWASGITVDLWNGTGTTLLATTTTTSGGLYAFNGLNPGSYEVSVVLPGGYTFDPYHATPSGYTATNVSNVNPATGFTPAFTLTAGQSLYNLENVGLETTGTSTTSLKVLKIPSATVVNQCGQVTYTFTVTNTGTTALTNVCITDNIGSAAKPDYVNPTLVTTGTNGTLAAGATWTYTETVNQINSTAASCGTISHTCSGSYLSAGNTAWLSTAFNPTSCANGATYKFQGVSCLISGGGVSSPIRVNCADSVVTFSSACSTASTVWSASQNCWITTLPANCNPGKVFLSGCPTTIPNGCNLSGATCTWTVADSSNNCGASSLNWSASACGYSTFNANNCNGLTNYNNIGVKSCDNLGGSLACGAPVTQTVANNCGKSAYDCDDATGSSSQNCITTTSTPQATGAADTVTVTATTTACAQATASDTKEVMVLGSSSNVTVGGTVPTGVLSTLYGTPTTLEFCYNPGNSVSSGASGAVSGSNSLSSAYMVIQNGSGSVTYFQGAVTAGENIYADAALNPLTNTPTGGTFPSTDANTAIFAKIYTSQAAFLAGSAPVQYDGYSGVNGTMHLGDTIGSIQLTGYVGSTGGHLV